MTSDNVTRLQEVAAPAPGVDGDLRRGFAEMAALYRGSAGAAMRSGQTLMCGMQEVTSTLLAFWQSRAKDGVAAVHQFGACRTPEAVVEVQLEYARAMVHAYSDEIERLHTLGRRIFADVLVPATRRSVAPAATMRRYRADALAA